MNLLEAIKQIAEHSDKDDKQYFMPAGKEPKFPRGLSDSLFGEMYRQTRAAQLVPNLNDVRLNPDAVARFIREQEPSQNIEDRRGQPQPDDQFDPRLLAAPPLRRDDPASDPLAQLLGYYSIGSKAMTVPDDVPLPRPRPRR